MATPMKDALCTLMEAAATFVDGTPQYKRMEGKRKVLLDAITTAQLVLSVAGSTEKEPRGKTPTHVDKDRKEQGRSLQQQHPQENKKRARGRK